jgi:hypothetical protein
MEEALDKILSEGQIEMVLMSHKQQRDLTSIETWWR